MDNDKSNPRKVWLALSELYLDTELSPNRIISISKQLKSSGYSLNKIIEINKNQVFPILHYNLSSNAGVWDGFDEVWLFEKINNHIQSNNLLKKFWSKFLYRFHQNYFNSCWKKIKDQW